ncbi:MAG: hypothetical protein M1830_002120, partial [Pleopsidium flavum]
MSLNGLDATKVDGAYQAALAEAGGWFLLQYTSRDQVDLLLAGNGGVVEVREAIARYDEKSPLYGFVQYRRRKVLLKYVPEGTSRLLRARVTVHFQSIIERFTPHDTVFSISAPSDLKETAVSSACSLHTASGSISSSNSSLRRQRLQEIAEDGEDNQLVVGRNERTSSPDRVNERWGLVKQVSVLDAEHTAEGREEEERMMWRKEQEATTSHKLPPRHYGRYAPATPAPSLHDYDPSDDIDRNSDHLARTSQVPRKSSQSTRPTTRDLHGAYIYKPKVKLGPRPSLDTDGRPHTSGSYSRHKESRPISTLPAGIRMPSRRQIQSRPQSQHSMSSLEATSKTSGPPPIPNLPPSSQSTPVKAIVNTEIINTSPELVQPASKPTAMTLEKQRLMKALQLRKKQMAMAAVSKDISSKSGKPPKTEPKNLAHGQAKDGKKTPLALEPTSSDYVDNVHFDADHGEDSALLASSPISPSEGPSTQASSFTDENDQSAKEMVEKDAGPAGDPPLELRSPQNVKVSDLAQVKQTCSSRESTTEASPVEVPLPPVTKHEARILTQAEAMPAQQSPSVSSPDLQEFDSAATFVTTCIQNVDENFSDTRPSTAETLEQPGPARSSRRRGLVDPIRIVSSAENSDDNYLSDDSFMEELKSATVQEAKPVSVSKSPIHPMFPKGLEVPLSDVGSVSRATSNLLHNGTVVHSSHLSPDAPVHKSNRSKSASYMNVRRSQQASALMAKKINVSSGISRRIKALELVSSRETSPAAQSPLPSTIPNSPPPFAELHKASIRTPSGISGTAGGQDCRVLITTPFPTPSSSPEMLSPQVSTSGKSQPESISVTARILRDCTNAEPKIPMDPSEHVPVDLHDSPLLIEHQKASAPQPNVETQKSEKPRSETSSDPVSKRDSLSALSKGSGSFASRSFTSSRHKSEASLLRSTSDTSSSGLESVEETVEEKNKSRKSRLLRRMSSISSASRKSLIHAFSPTSKGEDPIVEGQVITDSLPITVDIGDVNVQFPDTLLWKRRHMMIDDQGYLILSPSKADDNSRSTTKRYHLSEFRIPYLPDQDRQELPN